jgi:predicted AlkP superfamily phosphohydrolase/phosphomutase
MLALALWAGCHRPGPARRRSQRVEVLLVGIDGASWDLMDPLLASGRLPHIQELVAKGVRARLKTFAPSLSIAVWTTIATGKPPEEHGLSNWYVSSPGGAARHTATSADRRAEALWTILGRRGRRVGFVGWWGTWPAEPVEGYMVSDNFARAAPGELRDATWPRGLAERLEPAATADWPWLRAAVADGRVRLLSDTQGTAPTNAAERIRQARFFYGQDHRVEQAALTLLREDERPDLFAVLLRKVDIASHYMFALLPGEERHASSYARLLEPVYAYDDELVGRLIAASGPARNVILVSDHGFERQGERWDHRESAPDGIFLASGPAFKQGVTLPAANVLDVAPTVLHLLSLPVGRDMKGRVLEEAFGRPSTVAFVPSYETGSPHPSPAPANPVEDRVREELKALGYIR